MAWDNEPKDYKIITEQLMRYPNGGNREVNKKTTILYHHAISAEA